MKYTPEIFDTHRSVDLDCEHEVEYVLDGVFYCKKCGGWFNLNDGSEAETPLINADPKCKHEIDTLMDGGYHCTKCHGMTK